MSKPRKKTLKEHGFSVVVDSREQLPWGFTTIRPMPKIITRGLRSGDYSIDGFDESGITVERKSAEDLFGSVGKGRARLEAEFKRMSEFKYSAIIIERTLGHMIKNPPENSKMLPKAVVQTLFSWSIKYGVHVWAVQDRILAEKVCFGLFKHFFKQQMEEI